MPGAHPAACVAEGAADRSGPPRSAPSRSWRRARVIGPRSRVGALSSSARAPCLGEDVQLYPRVVVRDGVQIGNRVIVHSGAVLGADGFGYAFDGRAHRKIPQVGGRAHRGRRGDRGQYHHRPRHPRRRRVIAARDQDRQSGPDRRTTATIGEDVILVSQVGIAGSSRIGQPRDARRAGGRRRPRDDRGGRHHHRQVGRDPTTIPAGEVWSGIPAPPPGRDEAHLGGADPAPGAACKRVRALEKRARASWRERAGHDPSHPR